MKTLFISPYSPWPLQGGGSARMYHILQGLSERDHDLSLVTGSGGSLDPKETPLSDICSDIWTWNLPNGKGYWPYIRSLFSLKPYPAQRFQTKGLTDRLREIIQDERPDLIYCNFFVLADALPKEVLQDSSLVIDENEIQAQVWRDYLANGTFPQRVFSLVNLPKIWRTERSLIPLVDHVVCVAEKESEEMRERLDQKVAVSTIPNGIDTDTFNPRGGGATPLDLPDNSILLSAPMQVQRNVEAALWFARDIFPKVRERRPDATFVILGAGENKKIRSLADLEGINVHGLVDDVRPYHLAADVVVAPYRFGAGTKFKVLEALALGCPLVSTPNGVRGLPVRSGEHALVEAAPDGFASAVVSLLDEPKRAQQMGRDGAELVHREYSWENILDDLDDQLRNLVEESDPRRARRD